MRKKNIKCVLMAALLALTATACHNEEKMQFEFTAHMEPLVNNDAKVALYHEEYTYWEYADEITIASDMSEAGCGVEAVLANGGYGEFAAYDGVFVAQLVDGSRYFLGIHPSSPYHYITPAGEGNTGFDVNVYIAPTQGYRNDSSYATQVLPMVAHYDQTEGPYRLNFHSVGGVVRVQLINSTSSDRRLTSMVLQSAPDGDHPWAALCGRFKVSELTYNPYLSPTVKAVQVNGEDTTQLTILPDDPVLLEQDSIRSFYVVLPTRHGLDAPTPYRIQMTVNTVAADGSSDPRSFTKTFTVSTQRKSITYLRAIDVTDFGAGVDPTANNPVLVGNGTDWRPFKIYSISDLRYVRDRFAAPDGSGKVHINGQEVTANTHFRIMRSDIVLESDGANEWTEGIENFTGHMTYYANISGLGHSTALTGIENRSTKPLFKSIGPDGVVEGVAVRCETTINDATGSSYSPFCNTNNGRIINCHMATQHPTNTITYTNGIVFAGICLTNSSTGEINGCGCSAKGYVNSSAEFAGICWTNNGIIDGCYAATPLRIDGPLHAAGVCLYNNNIVRNSYYSGAPDYDGNNTVWGGLVYQNNSSATIQRCYIGDGVRIHTKSVGGIVYTNAGTVDLCYCDADLEGNLVGGIAAVVTGGIIQNSYVDDSLFVIDFYSSTNTYCGALVGDLQGGTIANCYANIAQLPDKVNYVGAIAGRVGASATVVNTYANVVNYPSVFYGTKEAGATLTTNCFNVRTDQTGLTLVANTDEALAQMTTNLNTYASANSYCSWLRNTTGRTHPERVLPVLVWPSGPSMK